MEETLGKRIVFHRKRLGLTQDALAELMGVTAQAVSKWENDQSCPDIGALPKLAEIFGISTDELLGVERKEVHPAEIVPADGEENDVHPEMTWELSLDDGKKGGIGLAIWILLVGGIMLTSYLLNFHAKLWDVLWPSALLVFGIFGLFPRFSFFRLGCSLFGPETSEIINIVSIVMKTGQEYTFLRDYIFTHPSMSEALNDLMNF